MAPARVDAAVDFLGERPVETYPPDFGRVIPGLPPLAIESSPFGAKIPGDSA